MKFRKIGQTLLASAVSLGLVLGVTACNLTHTIDFVYVTSSKGATGSIDAFKVDNQSGALTPVLGSPFLTSYRNPVSEVVSPDYKNLYVAFRDDNKIVRYAIGSDGKVYPQDTIDTPGGFPVSVAIDPLGSNLYVVDTYQPNFTDANPGPGALIVYPLEAKTGKLGAPVANGALNYFPLGLKPRGVALLPLPQPPPPGSPYIGAVYATATDPSTNLGAIYGFSVAAGGALTPLGIFPAGVAPNSIAIDPAAHFAYVTDGAANQLIGYHISSSSQLTPLINGPAHTDVLPAAIAIDPRGKFIYVATATAGTVNAYAIDAGSGTPTQTGGLGGYSTKGAAGNVPTCIVIEPSIARFVYTPNFLDNTLAAFELEPHGGTLTGVQNMPFNTKPQPTCVAAVPHGNHSIQVVQP